LGCPNIKLSDFGDCKAVLLFPKLNEGAIAVVVIMLFDVLLFTMVLKLTMLVAVVVLTDNNVPGDWDGKLGTVAWMGVPEDEAGLLLLKVKIEVV